MTDVFDEEDAALVLHFHENLNRFTFGYYTVDLSDKWRVRKLVRMGIVFSMYEESESPNHYCLKLNKDHPDVKPIIDAMDLL
jgi:hypothetical protein